MMVMMWIKSATADFFHTSQSPNKAKTDDADDDGNVDDDDDVEDDDDDNG